MSWVIYADNNWYGVVCKWDGGEVRGQSMGEMGKTSVQTYSSRFLKTLTEGAVTTEAGCLFQNFQLIPIFHNPHRKCRPSPSEAARTLEYLEGVPS